jgi:hypothetical protein
MNTTASAVRGAPDSARVWPRLRYEAMGQWAAVPEWASFFMAVGASANAAVLDQHPWVVAISVPTRAFAATLISAGAVLAAAQRHSPSQVDVSDLVPGTVVHYIRGGRRLKGVFERIETAHGQQWLLVRTESRESGGLTHFVNPQDLAQLSPAPQGTDSSLPKSQTGRRIASNEAFVRCFVSSDKLLQFLTRSDADCVIVGAKSVLRAELTECPFTVPSGDRHIIGTLQDLVRARSFAAASATFRSDVVSRARASLDAATVTVFDGASSYLRLGRSARSKVTVIVLDRSAHMYEEALEAVNNDYIQNRAGNGQLELPAITSHGIELTSFPRI